jgi:4-hydroxyphenylpyruvate dioxygenase
MSGSARPFQQARQDQPSRGWLRNSLATVCISGTLEDKLKAAAAAGFDGVELFEPDLLGAAFRPREIRDTCRDLGLSIDLYQPFRDFDAADPQQYSANLRRAEHKFDVMQHVGTDLILVCSSVAPGCSKDDDQIAEQLHELAIRAAGRGLRICYEALAWGRHVGTYQHSWDIVQRADHPALGVCIDSFHILSRGSDPAGIRSIPGEKIFFLQLADAPQLDMGVLQWSRHYRLFPGQGSFDLTDFVGHVLAAGYRGPLSLEVFNDVFRQSDPNQAAVDALRSLLGLRESVLAQLAPETSPPSVIALPPPVPELSGFAFVELSLDEGSGAAVGDALGALGFTASGRHVSKPVRLLQQSGARVLLNSAGDPLGAAVAALGVETADAPAATRRAAAMLAPALPRSRGPAEADISAVGAPDGTAVFFCPTGTDAATGWLADFAGADGAGSGIGITHVDHVALTQPFDRFDEAALFYRCLLGLQTQHASEVAAPFGLVRNRAVANPDFSERI